MYKIVKNTLKLTDARVEDWVAATILFLIRLTSRILKK